MVGAQFPGKTLLSGESCSLLDIRYGLALSKFSPMSETLWLSRPTKWTRCLPMLSVTSIVQRGGACAGVHVLWGGFGLYCASQLGQGVLLEALVLRGVRAQQGY